MLFLLEGLELLEVEGLDQGVELVGGLLEVVIDETVREEDGVIGQFDLFQRVLDAQFEFLLCLQAFS
jgi:hypothetical protein